MIETLIMVKKVAWESFARIIPDNQLYLQTLPDSVEIGEIVYFYIMRERGSFWQIIIILLMSNHIVQIGRLRYKKMKRFL